MLGDFEARMVKRLISGPWHGLRAFALIIGVLVFFVAATVLTVGWGLGVSVLRRPMASFVTMKPNTALGIGALALALTLSQLGGPVRRFSMLFTLLATLIGAVTLAEYSFRWDAGVDQLLFVDSGASPAEFPGRPARLTALLLILLSAGVTGSEARGWRHVRTFCSMVSLLITWTLLNGYLFAYTNPPGILPFGSVAVHTAGALFLVALGAVATQPGSWPVRTVVADNVAGTICRWLLPAAIFAPPLLGWLVRNPAALGEPTAAFNWALYSVLSSVGSVALIIMLAHRIEVLDAERTAATMMSRHDELTGLANRRAFGAFLLEAFNLARRYERPLSLLTIDVDEFKAYNDTYGHPAGDEVLNAAAAVFAGVVRETDLVARIGGEEFAMVLPETAVGGARALAERVRQKVSELRLQRRVTVSVGIAALSSETATAPALLEQSDAALYAAKRGGRNRVVVSGRSSAAQVMS
jgi:diguanylate cyclase (GGDEF)-like protein